MVLEDVAQKLSQNDETDEDAMVLCLSFSVMFRLVKLSVMTVKMDVCNTSVTVRVECLRK